MHEVELNDDYLQMQKAINTVKSEAWPQEYAG